jgi:hypothetical protein
MKISDLLCQYLYQNKELVLEGFGVFHLDQSVSSADSRETQQAYQGITFENNIKSKTPAPLVDFLVQQSGKMRPLAISDLEAFLMTGRELLNLGKPLILNGIGTLTGYKPSQLDFTPGPFIPVRLDSTEGQFRERVATREDELFRTEENSGGHQSSPQNRTLMLLVAAILVLLVVGWGVYHFAFQKHDQTVTDTTGQIQPVDTDTPAAKKDTSAINAASPGNAPGKVDSAAGATVNEGPKTSVAATGPVTFRVLIQTYHDLAKAQKRFDSLRVWGHNVSMETRDSTHYDIIIPFSVPLRDTLKVKDSLSTFFGRPMRVVLNH